MTTDMRVRNFQCNNCGAPLIIPKGSKGKVVCDCCRTECIIEGLVKNAEIQQKENINSGIPLAADTTVLHNKILNILTDSPCVPLDILEQAEIMKEEHLCIPAYLFYCNASGTYNYEAGNVREHKTAIDLGDKVRVEKERYVEWTQMSGSAALSKTLVVSGSKEYADVIKKLYLNCSPNSLVDIEELEYPSDVTTYSYDMPQTAAFNQYIRPEVERCIVEQAKYQQRGKRIRDLVMGGVSIQKDEIVRIFLGVYRITYNYRGKQYVLYISSTGKRGFYRELPLDSQRVQFWKIKQKEYSALRAQSAKINSLQSLIIVGIVMIALGFLLGNSYRLISFILGAALILFPITQRKKHQNKINALKKEIEDFENQVTDALNRFVQKDRPLKGIYSPYEQEQSINAEQYATV